MDTKSTLSIHEEGDSKRTTVLLALAILVIVALVITGRFSKPAKASPVVAVPSAITMNDVKNASFYVGEEMADFKDGVWRHTAGVTQEAEIMDVVSGNFSEEVKAVAIMRSRTNGERWSYRLICLKRLDDQKLAIEGVRSAPAGEEIKDLTANAAIGGGRQDLSVKFIGQKEKTYIYTVHNHDLYGHRLDSSEP